MITAWNYSKLAVSYLQRPAYSEDALDLLFESIAFDKNKRIRVCDIGAGVGHLTIPLLKRGFIVDAIEPNDAMRELGIKATQEYITVKWSEATGEDTQRPAQSYNLVTFGSSFNVTNRNLALKESHRILKNNGWFVCMWNHRDLEDETQKSIEKIIFDAVPDYSYGSRREDQTDVIDKSLLFKNVRFLEGKTDHIVDKDKWLEGWRSHATLERQAGNKTAFIITQMKRYLDSLPGSTLTIPYITRIWFAQKK